MCIRDSITSSAFMPERIKNANQLLASEGAVAVSYTHLPAVFSEFYVLMFWNLTPVFLVSWDLITTPPGELAAFLSRIHTPSPVILGLLVMFRFFPTMKSELRSVWLSMRNRGLTTPIQLAGHPAASLSLIHI